MRDLLPTHFAEVSLLRLVRPVRSYIPARMLAAQNFCSTTIIYCTLVFVRKISLVLSVLCRRNSGESNELIAPDCKVRVDT